jgi:hypothetical protein
MSAALCGKSHQIGNERERVHLDEKRAIRRTEILSDRHGSELLRRDKRPVEIQRCAKLFIFQA